jgi:hypothetical protein
MWESRTPTVYRSLYLVHLFIHFHITHVGVQDSHCVQGLLHCSFFHIFIHHKCGSPGLPLCTGPFTSFAFLYIFTSQMWESWTPVVYRPFYIVLFFIHFHITNVGVQDSHCVQGLLHCSLFCTFSHHKCGSPGLPLCKGSFTSFSFPYIYTSQMWESRTPTVYRSLYLVHLFIHFHITHVGVQDSHCVQALLHCSLFHTFSHHKCGSPGLPLCIGPFTSFAFSYIFTSQMWESRTPAVYRPFYIVRFFVHFHITNVGVQDSHCVQALLHCSSFHTFICHKCGSPWLPLCAGLVIILMFKYIFCLFNLDKQVFNWQIVILIFPSFEDNHGIQS